MKSIEIQASRVQVLNDQEIRKGRYVLYWMQQSQRSDFNHALTYAIQQADSIRQGVVVVFGVMDDYPEANLRHYTFMLEGLAETRDALADLGILMVIQKGHPVRAALSLSADASLIVCDRGYLRHQKEWRVQLAGKAGCRVVQVESDVVVPVEVVSGKAEYAARTIRPKIHKNLETYLRGISSHPPDRSSLGLSLKSMDITNPAAVLRKTKIDASIPAASRFFKGGTSRAKAVFKNFIDSRLEGYDENSNQPQTDDISHMSPYLHFGQISPIYLALEIQQAGKQRQTSVDSYLEQLIVRRELAMNFTNYAANYDTMACLPAWAKSSLQAHARDKRAYNYSLKQLEDAETHDPYWNACMREMRYTGFMHNYMRMYWGKKILEWMETPQKAFEFLLALNNKYFLDGRDPNSYAGVGWVFGLHDRAWSERPIFGKIRYMAASGLERKCDIQAYVRKVDGLVKNAPA
jgi:deoxyribodipyrimidine photo-lyase